MVAPPPPAPAPAPPPARSVLTDARRVVIKAGTRVLTRTDGRPSLSRLFGLVEQVAEVRQAGREVLLVSSGAVGLGRERLGLTGELALADRQACAAVGQSRLMALYEQGFSRFGLECAQLLLTRSDFDDRTRYLNLRHTLAGLLRRGVVPVINENDAVATDELIRGPDRGGTVPRGTDADRDDAPAAEGKFAGGGAFGDNDQLSALVAAKLGADLLILLTDVPGVFATTPDAAPGTPPAVIASLDEGDVPALAASMRPHRSAHSRGGMASKLNAAALAAANGCHAVIASGLDGDTLSRVLAGDSCGTWLKARPGLAARHRWIAFASRPRGRLFLDTGAIQAISERGASLLAAGVRRISGDFRRGDVVALCENETGRVIGRGVVHCDAPAAQDWIRGVPPAGTRSHDALVHRDKLVLTGHGQESPS